MIVEEAAVKTEFRQDETRQPIFFCIAFYVLQFDTHHPWSYDKSFLQSPLGLEAAIFLAAGRLTAVSSLKG